MRRLNQNTSYHSRGGFSFQYANGGKSQASQDCPAANAATSLHSRRNFSRRTGGHDFQFALRNRPGVTSNYVGSNPASSIKPRSSLTERHQSSKLTKITSFHSRNASLCATQSNGSYKQTLWVRIPPRPPNGRVA